MRKITVFVIAAVFSTFLPQPKTANADTTFSFTGTCSDIVNNCTGMGAGTLVLQDYTIGNFFTNTNFRSFMYQSNIFDLAVTGSNLG